MSKILHHISFVQPGVWGEDPSNDYFDARCVRVADFLYDALKFSTPDTIRSVPNKGKYFLKKGDILIEKSGGGEKTTVGRAVHVDKNYDLIYANFIDRLRPLNPDHGKFLTYYLAHLYSIGINTKYIKQNTGIQNLDLKGYLRETVDFPHEFEWEKISQFLDHKVAKINEAIAKKKKLLELLEEKRTTVINDVVQKANGQKTKIKHVAKVNPVDRKNFKYSEIVTFVPMEAVSEYGELNLKQRQISSVITGYTYFEENDVVIAKITPCFENGKAALMIGLKNGYGFGTTEFIVLRTKNIILPQYLYYLVFSRHFRENGTNEMRGTAGQKRLTESYVSHYEFNLPSIDEQSWYANLIESNLSKIDGAKNKVKESIRLLEEYKTSLISNMVTGKVEV